METQGFLVPLSETHKKQLKKIGVYRRFVKNIKTLPSSLYTKADSGRSLDGVLACAFAWCQSSEGHDFWENVQKKLSK